MLQASGNQSLIQMGIGMLEASWFKWESACYKPHGSNGNQSLMVQMAVGMLQAL